MKYIKSLLTLALTALLGTFAWAAAKDYTDYRTSVASGTPQAVMLSFYNGPTSRGFTWQTDTSVSSGNVWLRQGDYTTKADIVDSADKTATATTQTHSGDCTTYKANVSGLSDGLWSYCLGNGDDVVLGQFTVKAAPTGPITIVNLNDIQTKDADKLTYWQHTVAAIGSQLGSGTAADFILSGGDFIDGTVPASQTKYVSWGVIADQANANAALKDAPWIMVSGNHDTDLYDELVGENFYQTSDPAGCHAFNYGNVHVATIPYENDNFSSAVKTWLQNDLATDVAKNARWRIVLIHYGPYTTADHGYSASASYVSDVVGVMKEGKVDLVLQAHDHTYSKTLPYRWSGNGYTTSTTDANAVNLTPDTTNINSVVYHLNPEGTYYISAGCAGHRVGEGSTYATSSYKTRKSGYKIVTDKINVTSSFANAGDDGSLSPDASMFGILTIDGDKLAYDWYTVNSSGTTALFDTLRVCKPSAGDDPEPVDPPSGGSLSADEMKKLVTVVGGEATCVDDNTALLIQYKTVGSGSLTIPTGYATTADILVVGGGAGGVAAKAGKDDSSNPRRYTGNGGNSGAAQEYSNVSLPQGAYAITVGAGGSTATFSSRKDFTGENPGSGSSISGPTGFTTLEKAGGTAWPTQDDSGSGKKAQSKTAEKAEDGSSVSLVSSITGESKTYAVGGAGGCSSDQLVGTNAEDNTGNGGGGSSGGTAGANSGAGGSGIVVVKITAMVVPTAVTIRELPTAQSVEYGTKLSEVTLTGGRAATSSGTEVAGTFSFVNGTQLPTVAEGASGTKYDIVFTPTAAGYGSATSNMTLTVTRKAVTVTADNKSIGEGDEPNYTASYSGWITGESASVLTKQPTFTCAYAGEAGSYDIWPSGAEADNYSFTYNKGTLTVTAKTVKQRITVSNTTYVKVSGTDSQPIYTCTDTTSSHTKTITIPSNYVATADILVVGGGGGGGGGYYNKSGYTTTKYYGNGGNGGEVIIRSGVEITSQTLAIVVGGSGTAGSNSGGNGGDGSDSSITALSLTAKGGTGGNGGSTTKKTSADSTSAGTSNPTSSADRTTSISGTSTTYGSGGAKASSGTPAAGGDNTGNGGQGGRAGSSSGYAGGAGGSGIVIIKITELKQVATKTSVTTLYVGGAATDVSAPSAFGKACKWTATSGKTSVATVTVNDSSTSTTTPSIKITPVAEGTATITVTNSDNTTSCAYTWTVTVTVTEPPTETPFNGGTVSTVGATVATQSNGDLLLIYSNYSKSGVLQLSKAEAARYLVVGGGAGGVMGKSSSNNKYNGNGGNAGAVKTDSTSLTATTYAITVGTGGNSVSTSVKDFTGENPGSASTFGTITANGGTAWTTQDDSGSGTKSSDGTKATDGTGAKGTAGDPTGISSDITGETVTYGTGGTAPGSTTSVDGDAGTNYGDGGGGSANGGKSGAGKQGVVIVRLILPETPTASGAITGSAITYGETLAESTSITGVMTNSAGLQVAGTFVWTDEAKAMMPTVADSGVAKYDAVFTPADTMKYITTTVKVSVTVNPKPITVKADDKTTYKGSLPAGGFTYQLTSGALVAGDSLVGTLTSDIQTIGTHDIVQNNDWVNPNYAVTYVAGTLTVEKSPKEAVEIDDASSSSGVNYKMTGKPDADYYAVVTIDNDRYTFDATAANSVEITGATSFSVADNFTLTAAELAKFTLNGIPGSTIAEYLLGGGTLTGGNFKIGDGATPSVRLTGGTYAFAEDATVSVPGGIWLEGDVNLDVAEGKTLTYSAETAFDCGTYKFNLTGAGHVDFEGDTLTVDEHNYSDKVDGEAHAATAEVTAFESAATTYPTRTATVEYSYAGSAWSATAPTFDAVGDYTVDYRVTVAGVEKTNGTLTVKILKWDDVAYSEKIVAGEATTFTCTAPVSENWTVESSAPDKVAVAPVAGTTGKSFSFTMTGTAVGDSAVVTVTCGTYVATYNVAVVADDADESVTITEGATATFTTVRRTTGDATWQVNSIYIQGDQSGATVTTETVNGAMKVTVTGHTDGTLVRITMKRSDQADVDKTVSVKVVEPEDDVIVPELWISLTTNITSKIKSDKWCYEVEGNDPGYISVEKKEHFDHTCDFIIKSEKISDGNAAVVKIYYNTETPDPGLLLKTVTVKTSAMAMVQGETKCPFCGSTCGTSGHYYSKMNVGQTKYFLVDIPFNSAQVSSSKTKIDVAKESAAGGNKTLVKITPNDVETNTQIELGTAGSCPNGGAVTIQNGSTVYTKVYVGTYPRQETHTCHVGDAPFEGQLSHTANKYWRYTNSSDAVSIEYFANQGDVTPITMSQKTDSNGIVYWTTESQRTGVWYKVTPKKLGHSSSWLGRTADTTEAMTSLTISGMMTYEIDVVDTPKSGTGEIQLVEPASSAENTKSFSTTDTGAGSAWTVSVLDESVASVTLTSGAAGATKATFDVTARNAGTTKVFASNGVLEYTLDLTVKPIVANIVVTPFDNLYKAYGDADDLTEGKAFEVTGLPTGVTVLPGSHLGREPGEDVGTYKLNLGEILLSNPNYTAKFDTSKDYYLAITQRCVTVVADAGQRKVYGEVDPTLTYTVQPAKLANGDDAVLEGSLTRDSGEAVGSYAIRQGTVNNEDGRNRNYNILGFESASFQITKASYDMSGVKVANDGKVTYNGEGQAVALTGLPSGVSTNTVVYKDLATEEILTSMPTNAGTYQATVSYKVDDSGTYDVPADQVFELTIEQATLSSVFIQSAAFTGEPLTPVVTNVLAEQDTLVVPEGSYTVEQSDKWIHYGSQSVRVDGTGNFKGSIFATFFIDKAIYDMSGVFTNETVVYNGQPRKMVIDENALPMGVSVTSLTADEHTAVGTYEYTASFAGDDDHQPIPDKTATLTIVPAPIQLTADPQEKVAGNEVKAATFTYTVTAGERFGSDAFDGVLAWDGVDTVGVHEGAITQGTLANANYAITFVAGTMTVKQAVASYSGENYASVNEAVEVATTISGGSGPVTVLVDTDETVEIPAGKSVTIDPNGKAIKGGVENNGTMDVQVSQEVAAVGNTNLEITVSGSGEINAVKTPDPSKEVVYDEKEGNHVKVTIQTKTDIMKNVKGDTASGGGTVLTANTEKLRQFLTDNKVEAYMKANTSAEAITEAMNETQEKPGQNKLELWKDYALGITPETSVTPVTKPEGDTAEDVITLSIPGVAAAKDKQSGDYTISYQVMKDEVAMDEEASPDEIKVPLATGTYTIKAVFTPVKK